MDNMIPFDPAPTKDFMDVGQNTTDLDLDLSFENLTYTNQTGDASEYTEISLAHLSIYLTMRILFGAMALFGNGLTIFAVAEFERLQTCTNYLICNLAVGDMLSGLVVPLVIVHELYPRSWFYIPVCRFEQMLEMISLGSHMLHILYLSIDRYIYIAFPFRYQTLVTPTRTAIVLTITWINCLISVPAMVYTENQLKVGMPCRSQIFLNKRATEIYAVPQAYTIIFLTIGFHLAIAKIARKQARQIQAQVQPYNTLDVAVSKSTKKISRTLGLVLGVYLFCGILPQIAMGLFTIFNPPQESYEKYTIALRWSCAWVNPIIYAWRLNDFKIAFKKIFTGTGSFNEVPGLNA